MKDKIIEILEKYQQLVDDGRGNDFMCVVDYYYGEVADEILELFEKNALPENWRSFDCGVPFTEAGFVSVTLHWSPDTGRYYWNDKGQLSKAFDTVEEAVKNKEGWERMGTQFSRWLRLGMAIDWEKT